MGNHSIETALYHVCEMLKERKEDTDEFRKELDATNDWGEYLAKQMQHETDKTIVYTAFTKNIIKAMTKSETDFVIDENDASAKKNFVLLVADAKMLSTANLQTFQQKDKELHAQGGMLQIFTLKELQYNPTQHVLVPKHEKVPEEEIKDILAQYQVKTKAQLPVIMKTDRMARWLGLKHGDIVRITRHNENSGIYFFYRCCV